MKIILTSKISNLGQIGDIVEVKNGYAKNFLIPNSKAICLTPNSQKTFEAKRSEFEKINQDNLKSANDIKDKIIGKNIVIIENASDDGRLYGSVSSALIATKINEILGQKNVSRSHIFLKKPIKEIGVYSVVVEMHSDISFEICVIVTRSESEIEALLKADRKSKSSSKENEEEGKTQNQSDIDSSSKGNKKPANKKKHNSAE